MYHNHINVALLILKKINQKITLLNVIVNIKQKSWQLKKQFIRMILNDWNLNFKTHTRLNEIKLPLDNTLKIQHKR